MSGSKVCSLLTILAVVVLCMIRVFGVEVLIPRDRGRRRDRLDLAAL